jgi:Transcriptional regulatory protein, C terminal
MTAAQNTDQWRVLPNPFFKRSWPSSIPLLKSDDAALPLQMRGAASGRSADITEIITSGQSAIILAGAPRIGRSTLIHYLQSSPNGWSWRNELDMLQGQFDLNVIHFTQIDLGPLETAKVDGLRTTFEEQCAAAILKVSQSKQDDKKTFSPDRTTLRNFLRQESRENPNARYFVMLDGIERLGRSRTNGVSQIEREQDVGLAVLQECGTIRLLVDLNDEFPNFGVILSIEALPGPSIGHQFSHVSKHLSYDLARFTTMTLKAFTWEDAHKYLQQEPESFGTAWADQFRALEENGCIFSPEEQEWLLEQAGTHPYLLQQFCFHAFLQKQKYTYIYGCWPTLKEEDKRQIIDTIKERLNTFLTNLWKRLQEALAASSHETQHMFYALLLILQAHPNRILEEWSKLGSELRYILSGEGLVCFDMKQRVRGPGSVLLDYLSEKAQLSNERISSHTALPSSTNIRSAWLHITLPEREPTRLLLSEKEYSLLQTLLQHPQLCPEDILMKNVWGKEVDRSTLSQRMHQLRKKLKNYLGDNDVIENSYGGHYSLHHPEWFQLE